MVNFQIGDRVKCIADPFAEELNQIGTITYMDKDDCIVPFDNYVEGWGDGGRELYVAYENLELVNE